jgi:hypothetical protein
MVELNFTKLGIGNAADEGVVLFLTKFESAMIKGFHSCSKVNETVIFILMTLDRVIKKILQNSKRDGQKIAVPSPAVHLLLLYTEHKPLHRSSVMYAIL